METEGSHEGQDDLAVDLRRMRQRILRRQVLRWMALGSTAGRVPACGDGDGSSVRSSSAAASGSSAAAGSTSTAAARAACVEFPVETSGPFPAVGTNTAGGAVVNVLTQSGVVRSDITSSFGSSTATADGVPLRLSITLAEVATSCGPRSGYAIYAWHCNRSGEYSLHGSDIADDNDLRGVQVTDSSGQVTFKTIFPACYSGRYPHIHVELYQSLSAAVSGDDALLITQLAMPRDVCSSVYGTASGYSESVANLAQVSPPTDNVFDASSGSQLTAQTPSFAGDVVSGYTATVTGGVG